MGPRSFNPLLLILIIVLNINIVNARTAAVDFFDKEGQISKINEYCAKGCFNIDEETSTEWIVSRYILEIVAGEDGSKLNIERTQGRSLPGQLEKFEAQGDAVTNELDLNSLRLRRRYSFGQVLSLYFDCPLEDCGSLNIRLSEVRPETLDYLEWDIEVLSAIEKGWSRQRAFKHFCPPAANWETSGDYRYDWCNNAKRYLSDSGILYQLQPPESADEILKIADPFTYLSERKNKYCERIGPKDREVSYVNLTNGSLNDIVIEADASCITGKKGRCAQGRGCERSLVFVNLKSGFWKVDILPARLKVEGIMERRLALTASTSCGPLGVQGTECSDVWGWDGSKFKIVGSKMGPYVWLYDTQQHFSFRNGKWRRLNYKSLVAYRWWQQRK
ncbi:hypothetical protein GI582_08860 [Sulfitobacter sp. BDSS02]|nr:hypothetical protein [Sulfitobacter sp. BDSS02]MBR9849919.1 hypothetical protein [Paracoccaceae bacterium]